MDEEMKDKYNEKNERLRKKMMDISSGTILILLFAILLKETNGFGSIPQHPCENMMDFAIGLTLAILVLNIMYLGGVFEKIMLWKASHKAKSRHR